MNLVMIKLSNMIAIPMSLLTVVYLNIPAAIWHHRANSPLSAAEILPLLYPLPPPSTDSASLQCLLRLGSQIERESAEREIGGERRRKREREIERRGREAVEGGDVGEIIVEGGGGGEEGQDREVLAKGVDAVADNGRVAIAGAGEGGVGRGGKHSEEAGLAEAMAAVQQQRRLLLIVVPAVAHGAAWYLHLPSLSGSLDSMKTEQRGWREGAR